jgi:hypothetical protein
MFRKRALDFDNYAIWMNYLQTEAAKANQLYLSSSILFIHEKIILLSYCHRAYPFVVRQWQNATRPGKKGHQPASWPSEKSNWYKISGTFRARPPEKEFKYNETLSLRASSKGAFRTL